VTTDALTLDALVHKAHAELDWTLLREQIAGLAVSAPAVQALQQLQPETTFDAACARMRQTEAILDLFAAGEQLPIENVPDTADVLMRIERGTTVSALELRDIQLLLEQARRLRGVAKEQRLRRPVLAEAIDSEPSLDRITERLSSSIEADGTLSDSASPELARTRRRWADARRELMGQLKRMLNEFSDILRENYWAERDGRFVLPLRADAHRALEGAVLDSSSSGGTLYVEPRELLAFNNRLRLAEVEVHHEEERVLRQLCDLVARSIIAVRAAAAACTRADVLQAIARFGERTQSIAVVPAPEPVIELRSARHPLLATRGAVVSNDIALQPGSALVISGPNAGGKTVILKQVGLAAWMVRSGIPLAVADGSRMGWFEPVLCNLGDAQSITSSLSTFSAHVAELAAILRHASDGTLVLLDEIAAGTDPEEGAALAAAVLEALAQRGASVFATTHHEPLKELATRHPQLRSAAVGFDMKTLMPTYRLLPDVAGPSTALAVATRYGIPEAIVARAQALIPETSREREEILRELHAERSAAVELRKQIDTELQQQRAIRLDLEQTRANFDEKESRELQTKYRELLSAVAHARAQLAATEKQLRSAEADRDLLRQAEQEIDASAHVIAVGSPISAVLQKKGAAPVTKPLLLAELSVGSRVHVRKWNLDADVLDITPKGEVKVSAGVLRATFALHELQRPQSGTRPRPTAPVKQKQKKSKGESSGATPRTTPVRVDSNTLDLRGMRVDESLEQVDAFVDAMLRSGERAAFVLHGHGTGALKQAVRSHLRGSVHVLDSSPAAPEDGGDAFTVFWLPAD
jgi:DNA mismatch repair protein MutS2